MVDTDANNESKYEDKTDEEIQEELEAIKKKFYDKMDLQLEKDLIIEEREKLAMEKRNMEAQVKFLKEKMKRVYEDDLLIKEYNLKSDKDYHENHGSEIFYDVTRNGPSSMPTTPNLKEPSEPSVPQRKSRCKMSHFLHDA